MCSQMREYGTRPQYTPQSSHQFDRAASDLSSEQTRLSISCWNPGPKRGSPGAIEDHIAGPWHIVALQESVEFLQHKDITRQFHVAHFRECPTLFNTGTFALDLHVKSFCVPAEESYCSGWALEAVLSKARFRRIPRNGRSSVANMSLHCHKAVAKKRSIALNVS